MVLCDSNVWLALALSRHVHHVAARDWLDTVDEPRLAGGWRLVTTDAAFKQFRGLDLELVGKHAAR